MWIRNGTIVTPGGTLRGDLAVADGRIVAVGGRLEGPKRGNEVVDATDCYVLPGAVDPHVHLELPSAVGPSRDDFESGSLAALAGGTTSIIDFVTPAKGQGLLAALRERRAAAEGSACDYALHMSVVAWDERTPAEMARCVRDEGVTSFKTYMAYKETIGLDDADLLRVMDAAAKLGALVTIHCEDGDVIAYLRQKLLAEGKGAPRYHAACRPPEAESDAARRAILMAGVTGCRLYLVHVSTAEAALAVAEAIRAGQSVMGEACPHHLLLDDRLYDAPAREAAKYVMSPPLRPQSHQSALWRALGDGALQVVATDHCPFDLRGQKDAGLEDFTRIPNGVAGVEDRLALLYTYGVAEGRISLERFVELTATAPARIFGLYPRKGTIEVGSDADLVVWDPTAERVLSAATQKQRCDTNVYEGMRTVGAPRVVLRRGEVVVEGGRVAAARGSGRYLARAAGRTL